MIGVPPDELPQALVCGGKLAEKLTSAAGGREYGQITKALLSCVIVGQRQLRLCVNMAGLAELLGQEAAAGISGPDSAAADFKSAHLDVDGQ